MATRLTSVARSWHKLFVLGEQMKLNIIAGAWQNTEPPATSGLVGLAQTFHFICFWLLTHPMVSYCILVLHAPPASTQAKTRWADKEKGSECMDAAVWGPT